jgi:serine/threonine protein kinase
MSLCWFVEGSDDPRHVYNNFLFAKSQYEENVAHEKSLRMNSSNANDNGELVTKEAEENDRKRAKEDMEETILKLKKKYPMLYEVGKEIGEGALASVYHGREKWGLRREVAIKVITNNYRIPENPKDIDEFRLLNRINHENIVKMYDVFKDNCKVYFILEYIDGPNLFNFYKSFILRCKKRDDNDQSISDDNNISDENMLCDKNMLCDEEDLSEESMKNVSLRAIPFDLAINFTKQIASAIEYCHFHDILHLDVKMENVMLHQGTTCKLCDFGCAVVSAYGEKLPRRETGTEIFHPPELIFDKFFDRTVDVWLVGYVMLELLTVSFLYKGPREKLYYEDLKGSDKERRQFFWEDVKKTLAYLHPSLSDKHIQFAWAILKSMMNVKSTHRVSASVAAYMLTNFYNVLLEEMPKKSVNLNN